MPLKSEHFRGDARLEACLISDPAHVVLGALGEHVSKIQEALRLLDDLRIDASEIRDRKYGLSTAKAVQSFKTRRMIINQRYQRTPDDIVGKMTMAALDEEMLGRQKGGTPPAPIPIPPKPVEPTSTHFSIRACGTRDRWYFTEEPPDWGGTTRSWEMPDCYQVVDETNRLQALYQALPSASTVTLQADKVLAGPEHFHRSPRHFLTASPLPLSGLGCSCLYETTDVLDWRKLASVMTLRLPVGNVRVPMFIHLDNQTELVRAANISISGKLRFVKFGFDPFRNPDGSFWTGR